jgi:lipopolysaccharide export system permease protein
MLILQFFWVYIDDLMGKGLSVWVILELLIYVSAGIIPMALPLAILLSSLMTFGNLAENNELTALKASGFSLLRIMRPLITIVLLISVATFFVANYVIPAANL